MKVCRFSLSNACMLSGASLHRLAQAYTMSAGPHTCLLQPFTLHGATMRITAACQGTTHPGKFNCTVRSATTACAPCNTCGALCLQPEQRIMNSWQQAAIGSLHRVAHCVVHIHVVKRHKTTTIHVARGALDCTQHPPSCTWHAPPTPGHPVFSPRLLVVLAAQPMQCIHIAMRNHYGMNAERAHNATRCSLEHQCKPPLHVPR
jgi:hypothetical protein